MSWKVQILTGSFDYQSVRITFVIRHPELCVIHVTEIDFTAGFLVDCRGQRDSISRDYATSRISPAGIRDVGKVRSDAEVPLQLRGRVDHLTHRFQRRVAILLDQVTVRFRDRAQM